MSLTLLSLLACDSRTGPVVPAAPRSATFLAINDTYRIEGVPGAGGLPRVRQLRKTLTVVDDELIVVHAGDLLNPSLLSRMYDGEQMIDVLNQLNGSPDFDTRMFATLGNHEFDDDDCDDAPMVQSRLQESQFTWLSSNISFTDCIADGATIPAITADNLLPSTLIEAGGITIGLFGLTIDSKHPPYVAAFADPIETARTMTASLRQQGAEAVVAITHLDMRQDIALLETLGSDGPDLLLGGHDHVAQWQDVDGRWVIKADADATSASVVRLEISAEGRTIRFENVPLTGAEDADVAASTMAWLTRHEQEFCDEAQEAADCLSTPLSTAGVELVAEELQIRRFETNVGNWITDLMRDEMAEQGAQLAFVNSGALRLNQTLPAGTPLTQRFVEELLPYSSPLSLIRITGAELAAVLAHSASDWTGQGHWLQVSGIAFRFDPETEAVTDLTLLTGEQPRPITDDEELLAVTVSFLAGGNDGFTMLNEQQLVADGAKLKTMVTDSLTAAGDAGLSPQTDGRICNTDEDGPCQAMP